MSKIKTMYNEIESTLKAIIPDYFARWEEKVLGDDVFRQPGFIREDSPEYCREYIEYIEGHEGFNLYARTCMLAARRTSVQETEALSLEVLTAHV